MEGDSQPSLDLPITVTSNLPSQPTGLSSSHLIIRSYLQVIFLSSQTLDVLVPLQIIALPLHVASDYVLELGTQLAHLSLQLAVLML